MKSIKLTKEQEDKLLEMAVKLFPEYEKIAFGDSDRSEQFYDNDYIKFGFSDDKFENNFKIINTIHWFEFCMTHLIVRLSNEFTNRKLSKSDYTNNQYPNWFSEKLSYHLNPFRNEEFEEDIEFIHPVDYLYEEFLKIK